MDIAREFIADTASPAQYNATSTRGPRTKGVRISYTTEMCYYISEKYFVGFSASITKRKYFPEVTIGNGANFSNITW